MVKEKIKTIVLPNNIVIHITLNRVYARFDIDAWRSAYNLKTPRQLFDLHKPYRNKEFHAHISKTSAWIVNVKKEHVEELTQKLTEFLTNPDNLEDASVPRKERSRKPS